MTSVVPFECIADLRSLMRAEYREMPGLNLTLSQAMRLWSAEPRACAQALETLVESGFLRRVAKTYMRADGGPRGA